MKQFAVIGLGNFGRYLAIRLFELGHDVLVIDKDPKKVQDIKEQVTQAVVADATEREALEALGIREVDAAIVSIGTSLSDSILVTMNLMELGLKEVYAKALSEMHESILRKLGVTRVFFPEKDMANLVGDRLHNPCVLEQLPYLKGHLIFEMPVPQEFWGNSLKSLDLINRYGMRVLAVKRQKVREGIVPPPDFLFQKGDILVALGPEEGLFRFRRDYKIDT